MKPEPLDLERILRECEYEWNEKAEKYIQKQFEHWIDCYYPQTVIPENKQDVVIVPLSISRDFWRDVFTDVVKTVKWRMHEVIKHYIKSAVQGLIQEIDQREKKIASEDRLSIGIYVDVINELENVKKLIKKWFPDVVGEVEKE